MKFLITCISAIALSLWLTAVKAQTDFNNGVDDVIANAHKMANFTGTVLIANSDGVIHQSVIGFADEAEKKVLTAEYRFAPGSIIKEFTTVALMRLKAQGKISYSDQITKYLDGFPSWAEEIKIEHLLTHTSGLGEMDYITDMETAAVVEQIKAVKKLKYSPGQGFSYGNFVTVLRALIIEKVTGTDYKSFIEKELFAASNMKNAFARDNIKTAAPLTAFGEKPLAIDGVTAYMTALDIYRWEKALWTNRLISNEAFKSALLTPSKGGRGRAYFDFGFYRTNKKGELTQVWHDGTYPKHYSLKFYDLEKDLFIILLSRDGRKATLRELSSYISNLFSNTTLATAEKKTLTLPFTWWLTEQLKSNAYDIVFTELKRRFKSGDITTTEAELTSSAYSLRRTNMDAAIELMKITADFFPTANAYDSYVDLLLKAERYQKAKPVVKQGIILAKKEGNTFLLDRLVKFSKDIESNL